MIWLVGSKGMLGQEVARDLEGRGLPHVDSDMDCDITDARAVGEFAAGKGITWIVNCSAYTAVEKAESEEVKAEAVNARGPQNLATVAMAVGARIIHISTDYVFDGKGKVPYREDDPIAPIGAYGRTKAHGEALLRAAAREHFILRTAWLYGARGKNFVYTMLRLMNEKAEVSVVNDQFGCPTYAPDLAAAIGSIIASDSRAYGTYHFTNEGEITWYDFACAIERIGRDRGRISHACTVRPIRTEDYPSKAVRPQYSVLSKDKIRSALHVDVPGWEDGLARFFDRLEEEQK